MRWEPPGRGLPRVAKGAWLGAPALCVIALVATLQAGSATARTAGQESSRATTLVDTRDLSSEERRFTGWPIAARPPFRPKRTIIVQTARGFYRAWWRLRAGDKVMVRGVVFSGNVKLWDKELPAWAEIHFANDVRFLGGGTPGSYALSIGNVSKVRLYGGDVTNPNGHSFRIEDSSDVLWWGFRSHDSAGGCGGAFGITKPTDRLDIRGEMWNCGQDLSLDPHTLEPGTGLHGFYLGGGKYRTSGTFILKVHDQPAGAAVQIGPYTQDSTLEVDARRISFQARIQVAGNAVQWWGNGIRNVRVRYLYGEDLAGRVSDTEGLYDGDNPPGAIVIEYGRSAGTIRLAPKYAPADDGSVQYLDCR